MLWIDAPCIDQNNIDEGSQQVQLMGTIYRQAKRFAVWRAERSNVKRLPLVALQNGKEDSQQGYVFRIGAMVEELRRISNL